MSNISKHITLAEAIHSSTAKRCSIDNTPNEEQTNNMKMLACLLYTSPSPRDRTRTRMPSSA